MTVEALVSGHPLTLRLSDISGLITTMTMLARNLVARVYTTYQVKIVDLLDQAGSFNLGGTPVHDACTILVYNATQQVHYDPANFWQYAYRLHISGPNVAHAEMRGHVESFIPMSGNNQLRFTPNNSGGYQTTVITR